MPVKQGISNLALRSTLAVALQQDVARKHVTPLSFTTSNEIMHGRLAGTIRMLCLIQVNSERVVVSIASQRR
jgi:hypothetical protein